MKVKQQNYTKGKNSEVKAKEYLENKGYVHVLSNFENFFGEIDIIMVDKETLVFVEVKYKESDRMGRPEEMINIAKIRQVRRVAESFLLTNQDYKRKYLKYRIDAVCILGENGAVAHYQNIY